MSFVSFKGRGAKRRAADASGSPRRLERSRHRSAEEARTGPRRGPQRFNAIRRRLEGVTEKALTQCLRRLERNGLVERRVIASSPVAVEYQITPLGRTLQVPFKALYAWTLQNMATVEQARSAFDRRA
jgi:DNA-binding HxlR family transcriptional regulator